MCQSLLPHLWLALGGPFQERQSVVYLIIASQRTLRWRWDFGE